MARHKEALCICAELSNAAAATKGHFMPPGVTNLGTSAARESIVTKARSKDQEKRKLLARQQNPYIAVWEQTCLSHDFASSGTERMIGVAYMTVLTQSSGVKRQLCTP